MNLSRICARFTTYYDYRALDKTFFIFFFLSCLCVCVREERTVTKHRGEEENGKGMLYTTVIAGRLVFVCVVEVV